MTSRPGSEPSADGGLGEPQISDNRIGAYTPRNVDPLSPAFDLCCKPALLGLARLFAGRGAYPAAELAVGGVRIGSGGLSGGMPDEPWLLAGAPDAGAPDARGCAGRALSLVGRQFIVRFSSGYPFCDPARNRGRRAPAVGQAARSEPGDPFAGPAGTPRTDCRRGCRRTFRSRSLRPALRASQPSGYESGHPLAAPPARLRGIQDMPALRHSYWAIHARRRN